MPDRRRIRKSCGARTRDGRILDVTDHANAVHKERHAMKFEENRAWQGDVETMLASNGVLAGLIDPGFFVEIGFSGQREDSLVRDHFHPRWRKYER